MLKKGLIYGGIALGIVAGLFIVSDHPVLIALMLVGAAMYFAGKKIK